MSTTALTCPKCAADMRSYERSGVVVDQCTDCRGVFLDRGELDRLLDREDAWVDDRYDRREHDDDFRHRGDARWPKHKKRKGILGELLELGD